jgi:hypothetical protein
MSMPTSATADITKAQCIEANTKGQDLRRDEKFSAAREQLRKCTDASCPGMVRDDCVKRLDDLDKAQPSIVFDVKDAHGVDLVDVRVSIDTQLLTDHLNGGALKVDPGVHVFTFDVTGKSPVTERLFVHEGEAGRNESVVIGGASNEAAPAATASAYPIPQSTTATGSLSGPPDNLSTTRSGLGTQQVLGLVLGGTGVAGIAVGSVFGLMGHSAWSSAKSACGGDTSACTNVPSGLSYRSTAESDATVSTVAFIAGGVLVATGAVLFLTAHREKTPATGFIVGPNLGPRYAELVMRGAFQ